MTIDSEPEITADIVRTMKAMEKTLYLNSRDIVAHITGVNVTGGQLLRLLRQDTRCFPLPVG